MQKRIQICIHIYKYGVDIDNQGLACLTEKTTRPAQFTVEWACATGSMVSGIVYKFQKVNLD